MKAALAGILALAIGFSLTIGAEGGGQKEVTLKGNILCAKCALNMAEKCTTAIQVKDGDKKVTYLFEDKGSSETYHEEVCGGEGKEGTVTGVVSDKDGKKWIKPSKVEYKK